ncbi:MAG: SH3 domain-containing protein [Lachnospiraceae bacterium]|nr:SH3 domain-containing protein [Lachnospiraceae bacterium]
MKKKGNIVVPFVVGLIVLLILLVGIFGYRLYQERYGYSTEKADLNEYYGVRDEQDVPIVLENTLSDYHARLFDGVYYLDIDSVHEILNDRFYYGERDGIVLYCLPDDRVATMVGSRDWSSDATGTVEEDFILARKEGETLYLALDFVQRYTNFSYQGYTEPNRIQMDVLFEEEPIASIQKDTSLRISGGVKSEEVTSVKKGATVTLLEEMETWSKVKTEDGYIGYVENKRLTGHGTRVPTPASNYEEPVFTANQMEGKVSLVWHNVAYQDGNNTIYDFLANTKALNVVSPTWFALQDESGTVTDIGSASYVADLHARGIEVWPSFNNFTAFGGGIKQEFLTSMETRAKIINQLMTAVEGYGADGINIDIESISDEYGEDYIEFIREISIACRKKGITLSVDNYVPYNFNDHYHLEEQGVFADYVIIMGYDEHYAGSQEPGSVASIDYVTNGILNTVQKVPAEKVVNAVPFYTRIWTSNANGTSSIAVGMQQAKNYIAEKGMSVAWSETYGQNYSEATFGSDVVRIWLEDAESIRLKLSVMAANELAGVGAWQLGFETPDIWDEIEAYLQY